MAERDPQDNLVRGTRNGFFQRSAGCKKILPNHVQPGLHHQWPTNIGPIVRPADRAAGQNPVLPRFREGGWASAVSARAMGNRRDGWSANRFPSAPAVGWRI